MDVFKRFLILGTLTGMIIEFFNGIVGHPMGLGLIFFSLWFILYYVLKMEHKLK